MSRQRRTAREAIGDGARALALAQENRQIIVRLTEAVNEIAKRAEHVSKDVPAIEKKATRYYRPQQELLIQKAGPRARYESAQMVSWKGQKERAWQRQGALQTAVEQIPFAGVAKLFLPLIIWLLVAMIGIVWLFWTYFVPQPIKWAAGLVVPSSCSTAVPEGGGAGGQQPMIVRGANVLAHDAGKAITEWSEHDVDENEVADAYYDTKDALVGTYGFFKDGLNKKAGPKPKFWEYPDGTDWENVEPQVVPGSSPCAPEGDVEVFEAALSGQESGGDYTAVNARTGAHGRFQIMPSNWPAWSAEAGLSGAAPTPKNQDRVARFKIEQYREKFGSWPAVAVAWYAGPGAVPGYLSNPDDPRYTRRQGNGSEPSIKEYVESVMARMPALGADPAPEMEKVLAYAKGELGKPYRFGAAPWDGEGPRPATYDCSSLFDSAFLYAGIDIPGRATTRTLIDMGQRVNDARPGDLIFNRNPNIGQGHVGIVLNATHYIHAPQTGDVVKISRLPANPWAFVRLGSTNPAMSA